MEKIKQELYETPVATVIEVMAEGSILNKISGDAPQYDGPIGF